MERVADSQVTRRESPSEICASALVTSSLAEELWNRMRVNEKHIFNERVNDPPSIRAFAFHRNTGFTGFCYDLSFNILSDPSTLIIHSSIARTSPTSP